MELRIGWIVGFAVAAILIAAVFPTVVDNFYDTKTRTDNKMSGQDRNSSTIATDLNVTNDAATIAIFNLLPLFTILGGVAVLAGASLRQLGYI